MSHKIVQWFKSLNWKSLLVQFVLVVLVVFVVRAWQHRDTVSGPAPMIRGQLLSGETVKLDDYRGRPVLVHFWATWCPICRFENDSINDIANDHAVISVASWSDGAEQVAQFMRENNLNMPVIVDEDGEWAKLYGVRAVPASFIIDAKGEIRFIETGYTSETGLRIRLWWLENS